MTLTIDYASFTAKYPVYLSPPYDVGAVTNNIEEILITYPTIESCLPENTRLLAVKYALEDIYYQDNNDNSYGVVEFVKSRNDAMKYKVKGDGFDLSTRLWGARLVRLFKTHGCYHYFSKDVVDCSRCDGIG